MRLTKYMSYSKTPTPYRISDSWLGFFTAVTLDQDISDILYDSRFALRHESGKEEGGGREG